MSVQSSLVSVGTSTAVEIASATVRAATVYLGVEGGSTALGNLYLGGSSVTASTGFPASALPQGLDTSQPAAITLEPGDSLYAISASGTIDTFVLVTGAAS